MIEKRTRFLMSAVFVALMSTNLAGCDLPAEIIAVISNMLTGNGGDGCLSDCVSCAQDCGCVDCACDCGDCACDCDCAGCENCTIQPIPGGFNGAHPGARIANSAQIRVTDGAFTFVEGVIPTLLSALPDAPLPFFPLNLGGDARPEAVVRVQLRNPNVYTPPVAECDGNYANGLGANRACIRVRLDVNYRSCTPALNPNNSINTAQQTINCDNGADEFDFTTDIPVAGSITFGITLNSEGVSADAHDNLPVEADIAVINETTGPYAGYSRIVVLDAEVVTNAAFENADVAVRCKSGSCGLVDAGIAVISCGGIGCAFGCGPCSLPALVSATITELRDEDDDDDSMGNELGNEVANDLDDLIDDILDDLLQDYSQNSYQSGTTLLDNGQVCMLASSQASCPTGSTYVASRGTCTINSAPVSSGDGPPAERKRCVGLLLGMEGRLNLGSLLASISPGLNAIVDFVFAAGGDGVSAGQGYNINFFGGLENLSHDNCVPLLSAGDPGHLTPPTLPQVSIFQNSQRPGTGTGYHVGAAVSEEFVNYALFKMWDSGLLCLSVTSGLSSQLAPSTFAPLLFTTSINRFLFPLSTSQSYLGLSLRPQQPPFATTEAIPDPMEEGDEQLAVAITLPNLQIDFNFWTNERFTRLSTLQTNLTVELTIDIVSGTNGEEIKLALGEITFADTQLINGNSTLSPGDLGKDVGNALNAAAPLIAGGLAGSLPNIALEELINGALMGGVGGLQLPIRVDFGADSILPFEEAGGHPFVGIFFNLVTAGGGGLTQRAETSVEITSLTMPEDRTAFAAETLGQGPLPRLEIAMDAEGPAGAEFEYSYRTTFSAWSEWSRSKYAVIEDASLVLQQHQQVFARARVVGAEIGTDISSARADFTIDVTEPAIQVTRLPNGRGELQAYDFVYSNDLEYRVDGGEWADVGSGIVDLGAISDDTVIEVRDGSGNVASNNKLRGRGDPDAAAAGCGCRAAGADTGSSVPGLMLSVLVLGLVVARRRRRA